MMSDEVKLPALEELQRLLRNYTPKFPLAPPACPQGRRPQWQSPRLALCGSGGCHFALARASMTIW
jgi:hypothetical protein